MNNVDLSFRPMTIEDCAGIVALIKNCYGDAYGVDYFYDVAALSEKITSGRLRSVVAINNNQIVGHMALLASHPDAKVCEAGNTVVHRSMRGKGLMMQLAIRLHEQAMKHGFSGYIQYPTTAHSIMQKASVNYGGIETGIMLSYIKLDSEQAENSSPAERIATTIAYQPVSKTKVKNLARLPEKYAPLLRDLYQQLKLPREIDNHVSLPLQGETIFTSSYNQRSQNLQMNINQVGEKLADEIVELIKQHQPCVSYLDIPVDCNGIDQAINSLNELGFFFAGLLPEFTDVDILRLQRLSHAVKADFKPKLTNDTACQLLKFIAADAHFDNN